MNDIRPTDRETVRMWCLLVVLVIVLMWALL